MYFFYELLMLVIDQSLIKDTSVTLNTQFMQMVLIFDFIILYYNFWLSLIGVGLTLGAFSFINVKIYNLPVEEAISLYIG